MKNQDFVCPLYQRHWSCKATVINRILTRGKNLYRMVK
jgi:hypothetical protein